MGSMMRTREGPAIQLGYEHDEGDVGHDPYGGIA